MDERQGMTATLGRLRRNDTFKALVMIALLLALIVILPRWSLFSPIFRTTQLTNMAALSIIAIGLNLLTGYNGQISLGHSGIALAGAYAMGISITIGVAGVEFHPIIAVLFAGAVGAFIGVLIGVPALRLTGPYLAIATLALAIAMPIILKWQQIDEVTGGATGIQLGVDPTAPGFLEGLVGGTEAERIARWRFYIIAFPALIMGVIAWNLARTRIGRAWVAIRDSEIGAQQMGINVGFYKTLAFAISAAYAAIGGALLTYSNLSFISPESFSLFDSIAYLIAIVVGGLATIPGAVLGAAFITFQEEIIDWLLADDWTFAVGSNMLFAVPSPLSYAFGLIQNKWEWDFPLVTPQPADRAQDLRGAVYGLVLIVVMIFMPFGFWGFFRRLGSWRPWNEYGRIRSAGGLSGYLQQRFRNPLLDRLGFNKGTWSNQTPVAPDPPPVDPDD